MFTRSDAAKGTGRLGGAPALTCGNVPWNGWNDFAGSPSDTPEGTGYVLTYAGEGTHTHTHAHGQFHQPPRSTRSSSAYLTNQATNIATRSPS